MSRLRSSVGRTLLAGTHVPGRRHRAAGPPPGPGPRPRSPTSTATGPRSRGSAPGTAPTAWGRSARPGASTTASAPPTRPSPTCRPTSPRWPPTPAAAMAWAVGTWGTGTDRTTHAAVMLVLHDLMGASYPFGRLDVDRLTRRGSPGSRATRPRCCSARATIKADGLAQPHLRGRAAPHDAATPIDAHGGATVRLAVRDDAGRGAAGVVLVLDGAGAGWPEPRLTTGPDGTLTVARPADDPDPDVAGPDHRPRRSRLDAWQSSTTPAQRVARPARRRLVAQAVARTPAAPDDHHRPADHHHDHHDHHRRPPPRPPPSHPRPRPCPPRPARPPRPTRRPPPPSRDHHDDGTAPPRRRPPPPPAVTTTTVVPPATVAGRRRRRRACRAPASTP